MSNRNGDKARTASEQRRRRKQLAKDRARRAAAVANTKKATASK